MTAAKTSRPGIGVVGLGYWGPNLVRNFNQMPDARIVALCDADQARLERQLLAYPMARGTGDADEIVDSADVDVVVVATPSSTHYGLVRKALQARKHVFVTKPLTIEPEAALELVELADKVGRLLHVDHTFVYTPPVRKLKDVLADPEFGPINYIDSVRINLGLFQTDTNVVWDLAPHDVAILDYLLARTPASVAATSNPPLVGEHEHLAYVSMMYGDGLMVHLHLNWLSPVKVRRMIVGGTQRMAIYDDMETVEKVKLYVRGIELPKPGAARANERMHKQLVQYRVGDVYSPFIENREALAIECAEFLEAVATGKPTITSGMAGYHVVRTCHAINESLKAGGRMIGVSR